jgi:hypothetical protein
MELALEHPPGRQPAGVNVDRQLLVAVGLGRKDLLEHVERLDVLQDDRPVVLGEER